MKICIPFQPRDKVGGTKTFSSNLVKELQKKGVEVVSDINSKYNLLFIITGHNLKEVYKAKKKGIPIIQRLDGVYYYGIHGLVYPVRNFKMKVIHNHLADHIIYQSDYSKYCCKKFLGEGRTDSSIIYNGTDLNKFSPQGEKAELRDYPEQKIIFTASAVYKRPEMIKPIIEAARLLRRDSEDFKLIIAGKVNKEIEQSAAGEEYIKFVGVIPNEEMSKYERASDVFIFSAINPPCPNNVIEALASGLPVVSFNTGSMKELVDSGRSGELVTHPHESFWKLHPFDIGEFADNLKKVFNNLDMYKKAARESAEARFSLGRMINEYIEVFKRYE